MGLTRPTVAQLNTVITEISDPISVLNKGSTLANVDVGFVLNRDGGASPNVALYWNETLDSLVIAYTTSTGGVNSNIAVSSYANLTVGNITAANISVSGNISVQYLIGSGQFLTGLPASYSNVNVKAYTESMGFQNYGNVNVVAYLGGNITVGNIIVPTGAGRFNGPFNESTTVQGVYVGNLNLTPRIGFFNGTASQNWQIDNNFGTFRWYTPGVTRMTIDTGGNLNVPSGNIMTAGNVTAPYFIGSGQFLTGLPAGYSNVNVKAYTESMGFQNYGNVNVAAYVTTNGLTNYSNVNAKAYTESMGFQNYGNVNVAAYLSSGLASSLNTSGNILATGLSVFGNTRIGSLATPGALHTIIGNVDISGAGIEYVNIGGNLMAVQGSFGSVNSTGFINTSGNVSGAVILGGTMTTTGTLTAAVVNSTGNILGTGGILNSLTVNGGITSTGFINTTGNVSGAVVLGGTMTTTGTLTAAVVNSTGNILGTGGILNSLTVNGNETVTGFLNVTGNIIALTADVGGIEATGVIYANSTIQSSAVTNGALVVAGGVGIGRDAHIGGNLTVNGNIFVNGNTVTINANNLTINDSLIFLAEDNPADIVDIGFVGHYSSPGLIHTGFARDATDGVWKLFSNVVANPTTTIDFTNAIYSPLYLGSLTAVGNVLSTGLRVFGNTSIGLTGAVSGQFHTVVGNITQSTSGGAVYINTSGNVMAAVGQFGSINSTGYINTSGNISTAQLNAGQINTTGNVLATAGVFNGLTVNGGITSTGFINTSGNVSGAVVNAGALNVTGTSTVAAINSTGFINTSGNVSAAGIVAATLTGTLQTASQTNITAVGTLGSLNVTGNVLAANVNASYYNGSGAALTGINSFGNIFINGQNPVLADNTSDTLTFVSGIGIAITADAANDTVTISAVSTVGPFAQEGSFGLITDAVIISEDEGSVAVGATITYDLGSIVSATGLIYPDQLVLPSYITASLPTASVSAQLVYDSTNQTLKYSNGTNWQSVAAQSFAVAMSVALA